MRELLEAKIASLEETASQMKGLSDMTQRIAQDEYPSPNDPVQFQRRALEDRQNAIAVLTAAHTLKVILAARTKKEQIALMQHYVLEFGQDATRSAKLSHGLSDKDPQKDEIDQRGVADGFVVSVLNGILCEVAPQGRYLSANGGAQPSILSRVGQVLSWTTNAIAIAVLLFFAIIAIKETPYANAAMLMGVVAASLVWLIGRGLRYVLAFCESRRSTISAQRTLSRTQLRWGDRRSPPM